MTDRPIIFSSAMIKAIFADRKTMTRRIIDVENIKPSKWNHDGIGQWRERNGKWQFRAKTFNVWSKPMRAAYAVGDRLWVRESFSAEHRFTGRKPREWSAPFWYRADGDPSDGDWTKPKPAIHMPRIASRITLIVDDVRVERLHRITDADARLEGIVDRVAPNPDFPEIIERIHPRDDFADLWNSLHGYRAWDLNPWVSVVSFKTWFANIDKMAT